MSKLDRLALLQRQSDELFSHVECAQDEDTGRRAWAALRDWQKQFDNELAELSQRVADIYGA